MMKLNMLCSRLKNGASYFCEANIYVDSAAAGTGTGASWVNACTTLAAGITASAAGDDIYIRNSSAETGASNLTLTFKGTAASPNRVFSCTNANAPATTADLTAGAGVTTTGTSSITITGFVYIYGVNFNVGTGAGAIAFNAPNGTNAEITFDTCQINLNTTGQNGMLVSGIANSVTGKTTLINTPVKLGGATNMVGIQVADAIFTWKNTANAIATGSQAAIVSLFIDCARSAIIICDGVDMAGGVGIASGKNIIAAQGSAIVAQFVNCKYTSGAVFARPTNPSAVIDTIVTDSGATNYKQGRVTYAGTSSVSITVYNNANSGSATPADSSNLYSIQVITTANAKPQCPFECVGIPVWVAAGTYANSKVFLTSATASLKTNDVWAEVQYLGSSYPLGSPATTFGAGSGSATLPQIPAGTTPGTLAAASPAWGTGGLGNDYQLPIPSFTTSADGYIYVIVKVGKASLTVNIDPAITVAA